MSEQTIYGNPRNAALGDFRVVCATDGCGYGDRIDANGHGYTNHVLLVLAKSSLRRHQRAVDGQHAAKIQQHPIEAVIDADETKARSVRR